MKDKINTIDMNGKLDRQGIYNLFKTNSSKANKEICEKIGIFKHNMDFFGYYTNKNIKYLLSIFELKLSENNDEAFSSFKSEIEQYISCISQIILAIKLFLKTQDILKKLFIYSKNHLSKLKYENNLENYNKDFLFFYLESLLQNSEKNTKFNSSTSTLLSNNISSFEALQKYSKFRKLSCEHKIHDFSNVGIESIIYDDPTTPKFESEEEFENEEKKNSNMENSFEYHSNIKKGTIFSFSEYAYPEKLFTPKNLESKLIEPPIVQPKIKNTFTKEIIPKNKNVNIAKKDKKKIHLFSEVDATIKNNKKNHCKNLLEMINKIYKKGIINSEEKVKLKLLVIEKSKKIEYLYYNIYKSSKNVKNRLISEIKKIVD